MDRSQQTTNIHEQTGLLCLRQNINSSRIINKKELKHQCQHLQLEQQKEKNDSSSIFSKTLIKETDDNTDAISRCSSCSGGIKTADVASNNIFSKDLQHTKQKDTMDILRQKNKILLNKYKLIRRTSSSLSSSVSSDSVATATTNNIIKGLKGKEGFIKKSLVNSSGVVIEGQQPLAKRIVKLKLPVSPLRKVKPNKQISSNYYRKINNATDILNNEKPHNRDITAEMTISKSIATNSNVSSSTYHPPCSSVIFKSPKRKVQMIVNDATTNKYQSSKRRYSLVVNKPNTSSTINTAKTSNATSTLTSTITKED